MKYDKLLSNSAFNCNLRHYTVASLTLAGSSARQQRAAAATAMCSVVRFVLSGSTRFWTQPLPWLSAFLVGHTVQDESRLTPC